MIRILPATPDHLADVRRYWVRVLMPTRCGRDGGPVVPLGRVEARRETVLEASRLLVDAILDRCEVRVAESATVPGEAIGFIAWSDTDDGRLVHMVYVLGPDKPEGARRLGVGTALLEAAVGDSERWSADSATPDGEALLDAYRRKERAA